MRIYKHKHSGIKSSCSEEPQYFETIKEGGTKKEYEEFLEKFQNHVTISWDFGKDIGHLLKHMEDPKIPESIDMTVAKEAVK